MIASNYMEDEPINGYGIWRWGRSEILVEFIKSMENGKRFVSLDYNRIRSVDCKYERVRVR